MIGEIYAVRRAEYSLLQRKRRRGGSTLSRHIFRQVFLAYHNTICRNYGDFIVSSVQKKIDELLRRMQAELAQNGRNNGTTAFSISL